MENMENEAFTSDIVCQVLVERRSAELIYAVLNEFLPGYESINLDYVGKPDDENAVFRSEDEMVRCYIEAPSVRQTFYWNKYHDNPESMTVGVNITNDDQMVFSLTFDGTQQTESEYYLRLKRFLESSIGVISYVNPAAYDDGNDFKRRYEKEVYPFEK